MVLPARLADPDRGIGADLLEEVRTDLQAAGAAQRLHGYHPLFHQGIRRLAEDQFLDGLVVRGNAVDRQVAPWRRGLEKLGLGALYTLEQGNLAVVVVINPYAEVDLLRVRVGDKSLGDAEDRIARRHRHGGE